MTLMWSKNIMEENEWTKPENNYVDGPIVILFDYFTLGKVSDKHAQCIMRNSVVVIPPQDFKHVLFVLPTARKHKYKTPLFSCGITHVSNFVNLRLAILHLLNAFQRISFKNVTFG